MTALDQDLFRRLLPILLSRRCEDRIPRSGERGERVNCFVVYASREGHPELMIERLDGDRIHGRSWDGSQFADPITITFDDLDPKAIEVTHFWGLAELNFHGVRDFAFGFWTKLPYLLILLQRMGADIAQKIFNRRTMTSRKRLSLLRDLVKAALAGQNQLSALDVMTRRYGYRWAGHPQWREHQRELEVQLSMLADTGELSSAGGTEYSVTGHAVRALEHEEEADRRQRTNVYLQLAIVFLTAATVFTGLLQAEVLKLPALLDFSPPPVRPAETLSPGCVVAPVAIPATSERENSK